MSRIAIMFAVLASIGSINRVDADGPLFVPGSPVPVGRGSGEVVLVDINRDGHLDIITKHLLKRMVNVQLGDGTGRFTAVAGGPMRFPYEPGAIALEDVNGDAFLDLVVASKDAKKEYIRVFPGTGSGAFSSQAGSSYTIGPSFEFYKPIVHVVDINEDNNRDIVAANGRGDSIVVLLGDGRGQFSTGPVVKLDPGRELYTFAVGDVDGDRHADLVTATSRSGAHANRLAVKRGDGRGGFPDGTASLPVPAGPRVEALADVNGDGRLDVVLSHAERKQVSVLLNTEKGAFSPAAGSPYNIDGEAFAIVVADVNRDKRADILAATGDAVTVLLGRGQTFAPAPGSPFRAGLGAYNLAVGDIDEDGRLDVAASSFEGDSVAVLKGR
jgi:hypothetical protein